MFIYIYIQYLFLFLRTLRRTQKYFANSFIFLQEVPASYVFGKKKATEVAHLVWKHVVQKGDTVIDATYGNGYDTLAMVNVRDIYWAMRPKPSPGGCVYAMDIQNDALENTSLLEESLNPNEKELGKQLPMCHSKMDKVVPEASVRYLL
ncbi:putative rrna methylase ytqb [Fagus crenata]